ncbi:hypothetical protein U732_1094 [Clostridium argentinense CDC 2741]|uniref:Uncharacterized protein n=1 Tax=Clostridium argentinense CDC 2741 TaxID=1418104 RepID=A0A0C1U5H8_9CLOT|nr:hypothetical protein [Clostridium argentinense]ARC85666.1 hypothetical protein RSJ17_14695 [Clostridium argentinense]KIE46968.1 hypothetical protein U732_1094 [Clostridium argentinense CDC 2741]NFF40811.1 hypothetical protein [Clostridium argentinense]NFP50743.1 hypothetical protein [Clostridium argentinense]NFP73100.1 hypothetical protein [Clostridium argentinense]
MKELNISSDNVVMERSSTSLRINGKGLEELISEILPQEMKSYKGYSAGIELNIKIYGFDQDLSITTTYPIEENKED